MRDAEYYDGQTDNYEGTQWKNTNAFLADVYKVAVNPDSPDKFVSDPNQINKNMDVLEANAKSWGMSVDEYINARGGVNSSGYYGDSYKEGITLNPIEYKRATAGLSGVAAGQAINAASQAKAINYYKNQGYSDTEALNMYNYGNPLGDIGSRRRSIITPSPTETPTSIIDSTPLTPSLVEDTVMPPAQPVKTAPIDTILFNDESVPVEVMTDLIFEDIGGHELIDIARNDTINGQAVIYQPIKNLNIIQQRYNPTNIVALQETSDKYFEGFAIKLEEKIPSTGNGPFGENVYIEENTGDLIIEVINVLEGEQVESNISINGTIYEAEI